jgi:hypothetical protein
VQLVAPVSAWNAPTGQLTHAVAPVDVAYRPAPQPVQLEAPAPEYRPAGQLKQAVETGTPVTLEYKPGVQLVQLVAPVALWNVATAHELHTLAPAPEYKPALQLVQKEAARFEYSPAPQLLHSEAPSVEYVLRGQETHPVEPSMDW